MAVDTRVGILLVALLAYCTAALNCTRQDQCASVTTDYNYVSCVNGQCACRTDLGFAGNATSTGLCYCPYVVYWGAGIPYCKKCDPPRSILYDNTGKPFCVSLGECENLTTQQNSNNIRKSVVRSLYQHLIYPNPLPVIATMNIDGIFAHNVSGRVTPVGHFVDFEGCVEYFFVLAANPYKFVVDVSIPVIISEGDLVYVRADLVFNDTTAGASLSTRAVVTQEGYFRFNSDNLIYSFDLVNLRQGLAENLPAVYQPAQIQSLCQTIQGYCTSYPQFPSFNSCVSFMTNNITFGSWDNAASNSVVCRILHSLLATVRPGVHCAHTGPTGGGKCVDSPYEAWYNEFY